MRYGSVCSGIEAATVAWHGLGWSAAWYSEIEPFPCAVLAHHYPQTPNLGDMTMLPERIRSGEIEAPDILCGGTPCQAFSVAGQRQSLADARGNLTLTFVEIADAIDDVRRAAGHKPTIIVWENVPGVLNTADNAFGCFLAGVAGEHLPLEPPGGRWTDAGAVYGPARAVAWRVLDAQYFGVAQRRRRVFVVASSRDDFDPAAVLFEFGGVRRDTPPSREAGQGAAAAVGRCFAGGRESDVAATLETTAHDYSRADGFTVCFHPVGSDPIHSSDGTTHAMTCGSAGGSASVAVAQPITQFGDIAGSLTARHDSSPCADRGQNVVAQPVAFNPKFFTRDNPKMEGAPNSSGTIGTLLTNDTGDNAPHVAIAMAVRRLTPVECERLQGFPTVSEKAIIEVCLDPRNHCAIAALKCHKWQNSVWPADVSGSTQHASIAGTSSSTSQADQDLLAALNVQLLCGHAVRVTRNAGRSILYASGAEEFAKYRPPTQIENTVAELAPLLHELVIEALSGRVESHRSIRLSFPALSGATNAEKSGQGTEGYASDAERDQKQATFTISDLGLITSSSDSKAATLCCSALHAIAGCIPSETLPETFSIELTVETPYTAIPWRKKPAADCPDGPRYKALGNSWAVPVVRWIGQRIADATNPQSPPTVGATA